jgi:hypothetical protein
MVYNGNKVYATSKFYSRDTGRRETFLVEVRRHNGTPRHLNAPAQTPREYLHQAPPTQVPTESGMEIHEEGIV